MRALRKYNNMDRFLTGFDELLHAVCIPQTVDSRPNPGDRIEEIKLPDELARHSAALMRVNHAGEIAAQALYQGQALTARNPSVRASMQKSASEEIDHLIWCRHRLRELRSRPSYLDPVWYLGSLGIGTIAGLAGDKWSLGFVAETERQVEAHLDSHLTRLPEADAASRAILQQMKLDERHHATVAVESGAAELPGMVKGLMRFCSGVMTKTAYWI